MMSVVILEGILSSRDLLNYPEAYEAILKAYKEMSARPLYLYKEVDLHRRMKAYLRMRNPNFKW